MHGFGKKLGEIAMDIEGTDALTGRWHDSPQSATAAAIRCTASAIS
jgi:hypothetical protein